MKVSCMLGAGDKEQRVVSLTAKYTAARMKEAAASRRADASAKDLAATREAKQQLQTQLEAAQKELARLNAELQAATASSAAAAADRESALASSEAAASKLRAVEDKMTQQAAELEAASARASDAEHALLAAKAAVKKDEAQADRWATSSSIFRYNIICSMIYVYMQHRPIPFVLSFVLIITISMHMWLHCPVHGSCNQIPALHAEPLQG